MQRRRMEGREDVAMATDLVEGFLDESGHGLGQPELELLGDHLLLVGLVPEFLDFDEQPMDELRVDGRGSVDLGHGDESILVDIVLVKLSQKRKSSTNT